MEAEQVGPGAPAPPAGTARWRRYRDHPSPATALAHHLRRARAAGLPPLFRSRPRRLRPCQGRRLRWVPRVPGDEAWQPAAINLPVTSGNAVWTGPGARALLEVGQSRLALAPETDLQIATLDDRALFDPRPDVANQADQRPDLRRLDVGRRRDGLGRDAPGPAPPLPGGQYPDRLRREQERALRERQRDRAEDEQRRVLDRAQRGQADQQRRAQERAQERMSYWGIWVTP